MRSYTRGKNSLLNAEQTCGASVIGELRFFNANHNTRLLQPTPWSKSSRRKCKMAPGLSYGISPSVLIILFSLSIFHASVMSIPIITPSPIITLADLDTGQKENHCTSDSEWLASGYYSTDCMAAVQLLYIREVTAFKDQDFEFLSARVRARSLPWKRTPRKYTFGEPRL